jgi:hypothetical protein
MGPIASLNTKVKRKSLPLPGIELRLSSLPSSCSLINIKIDVLWLSWSVGIEHDMGKQMDM